MIFIDITDPETETLVSAETMAFAIPLYSRKKVNEAGEILTDFWLRDDFAGYDFGQYWNAVDIINNWRASHSGPLLAMRMLLTRQAESVTSDALIAQRIKRLYSIDLKLRRFRTMKLSQMQDIGGCRAIVGTVKQVQELADNFKKSRTKHVLDHVDDYIERPQDTGYRGIHLIYRFRSNARLEYNGLKIEVQLRSALQHAWATAVETVGTFTRQALKSSQGEAEWLRFFELMGTVVAINENTKPVFNTPADTDELVNEIAKYASDLDIISRLERFRQALQQIEAPDLTDGNARYFLLELDPSADAITITGYRVNEYEKATTDYALAEKRITQNGGDAVLVSVNSVTALRRAYPNYFLDTRVFLDLLEETLRYGL
jgi:hypothetical protein